MTVNATQYKPIGPQLAKAADKAHEFGRLVHDFVVRYGPNRPSSEMLAALMDYLRIRNIALESVGADLLVKAALLERDDLVNPPSR